MFPRNGLALGISTYRVIRLDDLARPDIGLGGLLDRGFGHFAGWFWGPKAVNWSTSSIDRVRPGKFVITKTKLELLQNLVPQDKIT